MGNLFSKKNKSKITAQDKAVLQLKQQRDMLRQYQKRIETSLGKDRFLARTLVAEGKKERALLLLRKKRYQETLLANTDKQLNNLEQLASEIEFAQIEFQVVDGLNIGNRALKAINKALNIDDIERMLEETKEAVEKQEEINALLSGVLTREDEEAVLEEFDALVTGEMDVYPIAPRGDVHMVIEEDEEGEEAEQEDQAIALPEVPTGKVTSSAGPSHKLEPVLES